MKRIAAIVGTVVVAFGILTGCTSNEKVVCDVPYAPDYLVLVNDSHPIDPNFIKTVVLVDIEKASGGYYQLEKTTCEAYKALHDALMKKGVEIGVDSGYRSIERQQQIVDEFTKKYGAEYTRRIVATPGLSEHHTGLAVDIVPKVNGQWVFENEDMIKEVEVFKIIHETLPDYGFIVRYPKNRKASYEPWHLRYVGVEPAREIAEKGIILEEYLEQK